MKYEVIIESGFSSAHALRHYYGETEPLHGHNFKVRVIVEGEQLKNKVEYLTDFVTLKKALQSILEPMDYTNLNEKPPFDTLNPSAENIASHIAQSLQKIWQDPGVRLSSVTVWETPDCAARLVL